MPARAPRRPARRAPGRRPWVSDRSSASVWHTCVSKRRCADGSSGRGGGAGGAAAAAVRRSNGRGRCRRSRGGRRHRRGQSRRRRQRPPRRARDGASAPRPGNRDLDGRRARGALGRGGAGNRRCGLPGESRRERDGGRAERARECEAGAEAAASSSRPGSAELGRVGPSGQRSSVVAGRRDDPARGEPFDRQRPSVGKVDGRQRPVRSRKLRGARGTQAPAERHGCGRAWHGSHAATLRARRCDVTVPLCDGDVRRAPGARRATASCRASISPSSTSWS